jgi:hypothetical protein
MSTSGFSIGLKLQIAFICSLLLIGVLAFLGGARPAKSPVYVVTMTAEEKYDNCIRSAMEQPEGLQDNALQTCSEINWTDTVEEVNE